MHSSRMHTRPRINPIPVLVGGGGEVLLFSEKWETPVNNGRPPPGQTTPRQTTTSYLDTPGQTTPSLDIPICGQTDARENITFPLLRMRSVITSYTNLMYKIN